MPFNQVCNIEFYFVLFYYNVISKVYSFMYVSKEPCSVTFYSDTIFWLDNLFLRLLSILLFSLLGSVSLFLDDSLDDLLFFDQESSDDSFLDGVSRLGTTVGSGNGLLSSGDGSVLSWSQGSNTLQWNTGVTTLWSGSQLLNMLTTQNTTWGLNNLDLVRLGVVC